MALKRHHKIIIGGVGSFVLAAIVLMSMLLYLSYVQEIQHYNELKDSISQLQTNTQSQINSLSTSVIQLKTNFDQSQQNLSQQISLIKASNNGDFSGIINSTIPSVVTVMTDSGQGTGFVINEINNTDYIVTNAHVLADSSGYLASNIRVITSNQKTISATFIGYNSTLDIAILSIPENFPPLKLGNSDNVQIGDPVVAIGNPLGLQFSASQGIISALNRQGINGKDDYIQTTAPLNPGNSGGPLINIKGEVIGINNFKITSGENLGFALESNYIKQAVNEIAQQNLNETLIN